MTNFSEFNGIDVAKIERQAQKMRAEKMAHMFNDASAWLLGKRTR
jgi:hypothetical protein